MSRELNLAIALPVDPILLAAPAVLLVVLLAIVVFRKSRTKKAIVRAWSTASHELGIDLGDGSDLGPVARGKVNRHVVSISPVSGRGRKARTATQYSVKFEATEAPQFRLVKRTNADADFPTLDTGNPKFDAVIAVQTDQPAMLSRYLTPTRRAAMLRLLTYWPTAEITNREAHIRTPGIEVDTDKLIDSVCHLVASAETFDRPTPQPAKAASSPAANMPLAPAPQAEQTSDDVAADESVAIDAVAEVADSAPSSTEDVKRDETEVAASACQTVISDDMEQVANGDSDVLTELKLDEVTVLNDLFNSGLDQAAIDSRFKQVYQGRQVNWTGEVVRVAPIDGQGRQRIAAFVGSADGQNPESGRVVALTAIAPEPVVTAGDVVAFSGALVNLDTTQRLFHVA